MDIVKQYDFLLIIIMKKTILSIVHFLLTITMHWYRERNKEAIEGRQSEKCKFVNYLTRLSLLLWHNSLVFEGGHWLESC